MKAVGELEDRHFDCVAVNSHGLTQAYVESEPCLTAK